MPPRRVVVRFPRHAHWKKTPGKTQDTLERLFLPCPGSAFGIPLEELEEVAGESEVWVCLLKLLPLRPNLG